MSLRTLTPSVLACYMAVSLLMRSAPPEVFAYRAWESMHLFSDGIGPFRPNYRFTKERSYGDLAYLGNLPSFRQYRREEFSTDAYGFRYPGCDLGSGRYDVILLGDSFAVGTGVSDDETLAAQVRELSGLRVCNAAGLGADVLRTKALLQRLQLAGSVVVWQVSERFDLPRSERSLLARAKSRWHIPVGHTWMEGVRVFALHTRDVVRYSPLTLLLQDAFRTLEDDRLLPNSDTSEVQIALLLDGTQMLFYPDEVRGYCSSRKIDTSGLVEIRNEVRKKGGELIALPVPDKYAVYHRMLATPLAGCVSTVPFVEQQSERFRMAGLEFASVWTPFITTLRPRLLSHSLLYWRDDTHWNAEGIRVAAEVVTRKVREHLALRSSQG